MHPVDFLILFIFLAVNVFVGFRIKRKIANIDDYALGGRNFSTATLTATLVATWLDCGYMTTAIAIVYNKGILSMLLVLAWNPILFAILGLVYVPRMKRFLGSLSIARAMEDLYGTPARVITAIGGVIINAGWIASLFKLMAAIFSYFLGIPEIWVLLLSSGIIIAYSTFGGVRSVTFTDVVQFFTFSTFVLILTMIVWSKIDNPSIVYKTLLTTPKFNISQAFDISNQQTLSLLLLIFFLALIPDFGPALFQRISMAKNIKQMKTVCLLSALITLILSLLLFQTAIFLYASNPNIEGSKIQILAYISDTYLCVGLKGFMIAGVLALNMSSADSCINSSSILLSNDLFKPLGIFENIDSLLLVRISAVIVGILGFFMSFYSDNLLSIFFFAAAYYLPIVTIPFVLAIFGFSSKGISVYIGMAAGFITVVFCQITQITTIESFIPGAVANFVFFLGSHYIMGAEGGWGRNKSETLA